VAEFWSEKPESAAQYGPDVRSRPFDPAEHRILDADSPEAKKLLARFSGEDVTKPEDYDEIAAEHFMFPTKEWADFLRANGYDATKFGSDYAFLRAAPLRIQDLKFPKPEGAATGKPIEFDAYRATTEPEFRPNPGRGTFFSPEATSEFGEHIFSARVRFKNPLVVTDGIEAAKILNRPVLARRYENLLSGMNETGETPLGVGAPGSDPFQKADADLARHARAAGYDGIIFSEHDDLNPTQYMAIGPKTVSNVQKVGKFNWKNATVEKQ
jgi:hypothetical protein